MSLATRGMGNTSLAVGGYGPVGVFELFFGILKRWSGILWVKTKLNVYLNGTWKSKLLKGWDGSHWRQIDS